MRVRLRGRTVFEYGMRDNLNDHPSFADPDQIVIVNHFDQEALAERIIVPRGARVLCAHDPHPRAFCDPLPGQM